MKIFKEQEELYPSFTMSHSLAVAYVAKKIADKLKLDSERAYIMGLLHDVGKKVNPQNHLLSGYDYLKMKQVPEEIAGITLKHSFEFGNTENGYPLKATEKTVLSAYFSKYPYTIYDDIVCLADYYGLGNQVIPLEMRLLDLFYRYGSPQNLKGYIKNIYTLKKVIEEKMHCTMEELFPEIKKRDKNINLDLFQL